MESTTLDTTVLKRMKKIFKTDQDARIFFLEHVDIKFRCNLCRKPQQRIMFKCCGGNQHVFEQDHKFVNNVKNNKISRMPFTKTLAIFYFCYHLYIIFGKEWKNQFKFLMLHTLAANLYKTSFHFKEKRFKKLEVQDFKKYGILLEKLAEKLNGVD